MKTHITTHTRRLKTCLLSLSAATLIAACDKEKQDPFTGKDNYITAFSLQQGDAVFHASIVDKTITVTIPENLSLTRATATVVLSENATIYPDPAAITEWDEEQLFAVTAHNGAKTTYRYTLIRQGTAHSGAVLLETQADVDAFGQRGVTHLDGYLTLGRTAGTDSITSLAPLAGLKEIRYALTLQPTCALTGLEGLENLEHIGGLLQFGGTTTATALKRLEKVALPALKSAGGIILQNTVTIIIELPELTNISAQLSLNCPLLQLHLPNLQTAASLTLSTAATNSTAALTSVALPALEEAGPINISYFPKLHKIALPRLKKGGSITLTRMPQLSFIDTPQLTEVTGTITLGNLNILSEISWPELQRAGALDYSYCDGLSTLDFPKLTNINTINLSNLPALTSFSGFPALQAVGTFTFTFSAMDTIAFPAALQQIGLLSIDFRQGYGLVSEINVTGITIGELQILADAVRAKLVGDEIFHGTLTINPRGASNAATTPFPKLDGFSEIDSLYLPSAEMNNVHVAGIRKVNKGIYMTSDYSRQTHAFSLPDLEEVGGRLYIDYYAMSASSTFTSVEFKKLQRVGGYFFLTAIGSSAATITCPELTSIGGDFNLSACYDYSTTHRGFETLYFPKLTTINGKLTIHSESSSRNNTRLKDLNGFAALTNVKAIEVTRQGALIDYTGLQNAFPSLTSPADWSATHNAYNPSYQDLLDGKWVKP
ncbi:MAG: DUF5018 domain-containing protein [Prevotellaceae bacterium]|jgi:hypothetical protein|nr:DUF5018 domain-containing protein [Prevotellaceae bacterium]